MRTSPHLIFLAMVVSHQPKILVAHDLSQTIQKVLPIFMGQRELETLPLISANLTLLSSDDSYAK